MSPKLHEFAVVLKRDGQNTPWGIRLVGGNDLDTPLIITRVKNIKKYNKKHLTVNATMLHFSSDI